MYEEIIKALDEAAKDNSVITVLTGTFIFCSAIFVFLRGMFSKEMHMHTLFLMKSQTS